MSDMRQKLLPVFLEEAARKIRQLEEFIVAGGEGSSLDDLEVAFRAAHTLKGTAALVQAEAVRSLSARIEGLLEGHFERGRLPSDVEFEAMELALDRLKQLISAVENDLTEPAGVLAEAELALKLALTLPGQSRLVELFESGDSDDPFAEDPMFADDVELVDDAESNKIFSADTDTPADDPFLNDPEIEPSSIDLQASSTNSPFEVLDPFTDDPDLLEQTVSDENDSSVGSTLSSSTIVDPFADDPALEFVQDELPEPLDEPEDVSFETLLPPEIAAPQLDDEFSAEPVIEEPAEASFIERMRKRIEKESSLQTAERLARTLLSQDETESATREYLCCCFNVAARDYYLPIANMIEISDLPKIIHLPLAPAVVRGLINIRGEVLPVIDLGVSAGGSTQYVAVRKLVIAEAGGEKLAFLTDGIPSLSEEILGEKVDVMNFVDQFRAGAS